MSMPSDSKSDQTVTATHLSELVHELRQPLNLIYLVSNNIKRRAETPGHDLSTDYLIAKMSIIADSIDQSSAFLDQIANACAVIQSQRQ